MIRLLFSIVLVSFFGELRAQWPNIEFEQSAPGTYSTSTGVSGWTLSSQPFTSCATNNSWTPGSPEFSIMATPVFSVPNIGTVTTSVLGGTNIARFHDLSPGSLRTRLSRKIAVTSYCTYFVFAYAAVFETGEHACCAQSSFSVLIKDSAGNTVSCPSFTLGGSGCAYVPGYSVTSSAEWTDWKIMSFSLNDFLGSSCTVEFIVSDCSQGDHAATVFLDAHIFVCSGVDCCSFTPPPPTISYSYCAGSNALLEVSPYYSAYLWQGPSGHPVPPNQATLSAINLTNAVPATYSVALVTAPGCIEHLTVAVTQQSVNIANITSKPSCPGGTSGSATVLPAGSTTGYQINWRNSSNSVIATGSVLSGVPSGVYSVEIFATGSASAICGTDSAVVTIGSATPPLQFQLKTYCTGQPAVLAAGTGSNYQWYFGTYPIPASSGGTASTFTVQNPTTGIFPIVAYDGPQGCRDSVAFNFYNTPPGTLSVTSNPLTCAGTNTGSAVFSFTPSFPPNGYNYTLTAISLSNTPTFSTVLTGSGTANLANLAASGIYSISVFDGICTSNMTFSVNTQERPNVSIAPSATVDVCSGNVVIASALIVNGSPTSYNFSWTPNTWMPPNGGTVSSTAISPTTAPGTSLTTVYTVEVNPHTIPCPTTKTIEIRVFSPVTPTITPLPALCSNASTIIAVATPTGGSFSGLSGAISTSGLLDPSKLLPGVHTFSYTNTMATCGAQAVSHVTILAMPSLSITGNTQICAGDTSTLTVSGAQTYLWPGVGTGSQVIVAPASTTSYVVTGSSGNGCSASQTIVVDITPSPSLNFSGTSEICLGDTAILTAAGADQFLWSNSVITPTVELAPQTTSTYSVTGTNLPGNCTQTAAVTVTVHPLPVISLSGADTICVGDLVQVVATGAQTYSWNGTPAGATFTAIATGDLVLSVLGTDQHGCESATGISIVTTDCTGIPENDLSNGVYIYPNPVNASLMISAPKGSVLKLYNTAGKLLIETTSEEPIKKIELDDYPDGVYYLQVDTGNRVYVEKIVKQRMSR